MTHAPAVHLVSTLHANRRFSLCLLECHYRTIGLAILTELSLDDTADGEPHHDIWEGQGRWQVSGGHDTEGDESGPAEATPAVLSLECKDARGYLGPIAREVVNALLGQLEGELGDVVEGWT